MTPNRCITSTERQTDHISLEPESSSLIKPVFFLSEGS